MEDYQKKILIGLGIACGVLITTLIVALLCRSNPCRDAHKLVNKAYAVQLNDIRQDPTSLKKLEDAWNKLNSAYQLCPNVEIDSVYIRNLLKLADKQYRTYISLSGEAAVDNASRCLNICYAMCDIYEFLRNDILPCEIPQKPVVPTTSETENPYQTERVRIAKKYVSIGKRHEKHYLDETDAQIKQDEKDYMQKAYDAAYKYDPTDANLELKNKYNKND